MYGNGDFFYMKGVVEEFFEKIGMHGRESVSYTHLDVYKRQAERFVKNFAKYESNEAGKALVAAGPQL